MFAGRADAQTGPCSSATPSAPPVDSDGAAWLFPIDRLNESLPRWRHFGGEYRDRVEGPEGIGYTATNDFSLLDRFRLNVAIQPAQWLSFYGEVQDARIFFNHHLPSTNPNQDSWTLWQAYAEVGSSTAGWADVFAGRQVLAFGDERVIGPSNWTNVSRTFDVARLDLHHTGYKVGVLAASVVPASNGFLHRAIAGNNLYGVYGSLANVIPQATFEPYLFLRLRRGTLVFPKRSAAATSMKSRLVFISRATCRPSSTTTRNLTARRVLSARLQSVHGRVMPELGKYSATLPRRHEYIWKVIMRLERTIQPAATGTLLISSILPIMTNTASPIRSAAETLSSSEWEPK
jgi:hypothetical protein